MWRLISDEDVAHSRGLAVDDALTRCCNSGDVPILRLYTYQPCVLVGRFQHIDDEVQAEACKKMGIPINRRPTGGGSIIMGPDQLGAALVIPPAQAEMHLSSTDFIKKYSTGIIRGLGRLGIEAYFQGKNDLLADGRKIAGLGAYAPATGGKLLHASILLDIDIAYMLGVLKHPVEKLRDKGIEAIERGITTVRKMSGFSASMGDLKQVIEDGYSQQFDGAAQLSGLNQAETVLAERLRADQYGTQQWVEGLRLEVRDRMGRFRASTAYGTIDIRAIVAGGTLKSVAVHGDFLASETAILDLEGSLRWHAARPELLADTVQSSMGRHVEAWSGMKSEYVINAIVKAVHDAKPNLAACKPGACFMRA